MSFNNAIVGGGNKLIRDNIESSNYVAGVSGWSINRDGSAEFQDVMIRGELDVPTMAGVESIQVSQPAWGSAATFVEFTNAQWPYIQYVLPASNAIDVYTSFRGRSTATVGDSLIIGHNIYHGGVLILQANAGVTTALITASMSGGVGGTATPHDDISVYWETGALPGAGETIELRPTWRIGSLGVPADHNINSGRMIVKGSF